MGLLAGHETWKSSGDNVDGCHQIERGRASESSDGRMLGPLLPGGETGRSLIRAVRSNSCALRPHNVDTAGCDNDSITTDTCHVSH